MWFIKFLEGAKLWIGRIDAIAFLLLLFVFLPMLFIKRVRVWGAVGFVYSSLGFGLYLWVASFLFTFANFGLFWLIVALLFLGIGVVPFAFFAVLFHGDWGGLGQLVLMVVLTFGCRYLGAYYGTKSEEES